jgi:hypothetical protein
MSFQAYLDTIRAITGKTADDFRKLAEARNFTERGKPREGVKAGEIVKWLKGAPAASKSPKGGASQRNARRN